MTTTEEPPRFPFVALLASGGHTALYRVDGPTAREVRELGATRDDAAGEAFDKVAKLLGLGYPGGPTIDRLAAAGSAAAIAFTLPMGNAASLDMSFSGIKTQVAARVRAHGIPKTEKELADVCASFQAAVTGVLAKKLLAAAVAEGVDTVVLGGGVAANRELRSRVTELAKAHGIRAVLPELASCTDNAAMIAYAGLVRLRGGERDGWDRRDEHDLAPADDPQGARRSMSAGVARSMSAGVARSMSAGVARSMSAGVARAMRAPIVAIALALACASACSSTSIGQPGVTADAGGQDSEAGLDAAPARGCPGETPTTYAWRPPAARQTTACSEADLASLASASKQDSLSIPEQLAAALGPGCADCAMGKVSDTEWRAIVAGHDGYIGNVGGCTVALGASEACGKAVDELSTCLIVGCAGCADRRAQDTCADALTTVDGLCAQALRTTRKLCRADALVAAFDTTGACQSIVETVRLFCGPAAQDGG